MADPYGFVEDCGSVTKADAQELYTFMSECRNGDQQEEILERLIEKAVQ